MAPITESRISYTSFSDRKDNSDSEADFSVGITKAEDNRQPLLGDDEDSDVDDTGPRRFIISAQPTESKCSQIAQKALSAVIFFGSISLTAMNKYVGTNALGSFCAGASLLHFISIGTKSVTTSRIRQVALTVFGAYAAWAASQVYANVHHRDIQVGVDYTLIGMLGANFQVMLYWLFQQKKIDSESRPSQSGTNIENLSRWQLFSENASHAMKAAASVSLFVAKFFLKDPIFKGIAEYFSSFFISQAIGERAIDWIDKKIEETEQMGHSKYRTVKKYLLTAGYVAQILCFLPWVTPSTAGLLNLIFKHKLNSGDMLNALFGIGFPMGFLDGVFRSSIVRRYGKIPVSQLDEFDEMKAPENSGSCRQKAKSIAHKVWTLGIPVIAGLGMFFFFGYEMYTLENDHNLLSHQRRDQELAVGSMLFGFLVSLPLFSWIDRTWKKEVRKDLKDEAMISMWSSPRIFGVDPLYLYFALTNSLKMNSNALDAEKSPYHIAAIILGWFSYTFKMGHELTLTSSNRFGKPQTKFPLFACINTANTLYFYLTGKA